MNIIKFSEFCDLFEYNQYYHLIEDILILDSYTNGSIDNPNSRAYKMIKKKSIQSGISINILKKVFKRGQAAWNSGHRPGTPQTAWATGRVNSFITGVGKARSADLDLWNLHKKENKIKRKK